MAAERRTCEASAQANAQRGEANASHHRRNRQWAKEHSEARDRAWFLRDRPLPRGLFALPGRNSRPASASMQYEDATYNRDACRAFTKLTCESGYLNRTTIKDARR